MVDWHSPTRLARDSQSFSYVVHVCFGIYLWEFCVSLPFDLSFILGKRKFRWPLIFYFIGRYSMLIALIVATFALNDHSKLNCQPLFTFLQCMGNVAIGMSSVNLSIRTMAVWEKKWYIVGPLIALILGYWSLLFHGILIVAKWIPGEGCTMISSNSKILSASFIYGMSFDLIVLLLTAAKLCRLSMPESRLVNMMFKDGLYFFFVAFLANLIATVFMTLDLNAIMSVIANTPAGVVGTIAASRVVRHLANFSRDVETFSSMANGSSGRQILRQTFVKPHTSVHVQMDTHALADPPIYDVDGRVVKAGGLDSEAQQIGKEFNHEHYT